MKLQDAYVAEAAAVGNWTKIGYDMKDGDTFDYDDTGSYADTEKGTTIVESLDNGVTGWTAKSKVKLNDCAGGQTWTLTVKAASAGSAAGMVQYVPAISESTSGKTYCADLTPSFSKFGS